MNCKTCGKEFLAGDIIIYGDEGCYHKHRRCIKDCKHPVLVEVSSDAAVEIEAGNQSGKVSGMFMWKKYRCLRCGKTITILQAIVEE